MDILDLPQPKIATIRGKPYQLEMHRGWERLGTVCEEKSHSEQIVEPDNFI